MMFIKRLGDRLLRSFEDQSVTAEVKKYGLGRYVCDSGDDAEVIQKAIDEVSR